MLSATRQAASRFTAFLITHRNATPIAVRRLASAASTTSTTSTGMHNSGNYVPGTEALKDGTNPILSQDFSSRDYRLTAGLDTEFAPDNEDLLELRKNSSRPDIQTDGEYGTDLSEYDMDNVNIPSTKPPKLPSDIGSGSGRLRS